MKKVIIFPGWYPNKLNPYAGDFLERHAIAASLFNEVAVLFVIKDDRHLTPGKFFIERRKYNDHCSATILYYKPFSRIALIEKTFAGLRYLLFFSELIREHIREKGIPDLFHVHVAWRAGLMGLYCKWKYNRSYVISEQWSALLENQDAGYSSLSALEKFFLKKIYAGAVNVSAVSRVLGSALTKRFQIKEPLVIPNVVDSKLFFPVEKKESIFRFIHVSDLTSNKNTAFVFEAVKLLSERSTPLFELVLFAPVEKYRPLALSLGIENRIRFEGYVPHGVLARAMGEGDCLILYSNFETFGCVIIEANASGMPVIVPDIPVMHEIIESGSTGIFSEPRNPEQLSRSMLWMMNNASSFDRDKIAAVTEQRFGLKSIAEKFNELYA